MYDNDMKKIEKAQNGNKEEMTKLIEDNSGLVWSIVRRFSGRGYEIEDLYQIGCIGLIKAIQRFDTSFEVRLSTYAVPYILGELKRYTQTEGPVKISRSIKELQAKYGDKIEILAGSGVNASNAKEIVEIAKINQIHSSCKDWRTDPTTSGKDVNYCYGPENHKNDYDVVSLDLVKKLVKLGL